MSLTKQKAVEAMKNGERVCHFTHNKNSRVSIRMKNGVIVDSKGRVCNVFDNSDPIYNTGWRILHRTFSERPEKKWCKKCSTIKEAYLFHASSSHSSGLQTYCKDCCKELAVFQKEKDPEKRKEVERKRRERNRPAVIYNQLKIRSRRAKTPITTKAEFVEWYTNVEKLCAYCGIDEQRACDLFGKRFHIDQSIPKKGYINNNMVISCPRCNMVKNGYLSFEQMKIVASMFFMQEPIEAALKEAEGGEG